MSSNYICLSNRCYFAAYDSIKQPKFQRDQKQIFAMHQESSNVEQPSSPRPEEIASRFHRSVYLHFQNFAAIYVDDTCSITRAAESLETGNDISASRTDESIDTLNAKFCTYIL